MAQLEVAYNLLRHTSQQRVGELLRELDSMEAREQVVVVAAPATIPQEEVLNHTVDQNVEAPVILAQEEIAQEIKCSQQDNVPLQREVPDLMELRARRIALEASLAAIPGAVR